MDVYAIPGHQVVCVDQLNVSVDLGDLDCAAPGKMFVHLGQLCGDKFI